MAMFGSGLSKAGFGNKGGFDKGRAPGFGSDEDPMKKGPPMMGGSDEGEEDEGAEDEGKEKKPESEEDEGKEEETIEKILELFDELTPLIEKLRNH